MLRDRFSNLPDSLIHHIVSFLSTKEASSTILLSKRWKSLWLSQPTLDFNDEDFSSHRSFTHFVDSVLNILKDSSDPITNFRIKYSGNLPLKPTSKFEVWVKAALNLRVQHLELFFPNWYVVNLPSSIFVCSTIRVLKLHGSIRVGNVSSANLPSLKVLHLEDVRFSCFKSVSMILSGCEQLENLVLNRISSGDYDQTIEMLQNLTSLDDDHVVPSPFEITYEIPTLYNLTRLEISMVHPLSMILKGLQNCPNLQIIVTETVKDESSTLVNVPGCVPSISHLKEVYVGNFFGSEGEIQFAEIIMKIANSLESFSIVMDFVSPEIWKDEVRKRLSFCPKASVNCRLLLQ